jgi:hypothetical protein
MCLGKVPRITDWLRIKRVEEQDDCYLIFFAGY